MGKGKTSKNNDMSAIINKLQESYGIDSDEEDVFETEATYEDTEISSLLSKIISDNALTLSHEEKKTSRQSKGNSDEFSTDIQHIITSGDYASVLDNDESISDDTENSTAEQNVYTENSILNVDSENNSEYENDSFIENSDKKSIDDENVIDEDITFGNSDDKSSIDEDVTFGDIDDESDIDDDVTFGDIDDESNIDEDVTFGDIDDESNIDEDVTFGDIGDESDIDEDVTFGDIDDESNIDEGVTFGDIGDESDIDDDVTFGDIDDESDIDDDVTFGYIDDESDIDEDVTFGDIDDESIADKDISDIQNIPDNYAQMSDNSKNNYFIDDTGTRENDEDKTNEDSKARAYYMLLCEDESDTEISDNDAINNADKNALQEQATDLQYHDKSLQTEAPDHEKYIILTADKYTDDPLQWHLGTHSITMGETVSDDEEEDTAKKSNEFRDDDISLLLQLGYRKELNTEVGADRTDSVVQNIKNSYRPDKNRIPFGFCGKEFSSNEQINGIRQKFAADKRMIIVKIALFSCIAFILMLLGIFFKGCTDVNSLIMFSFMEIVIMTLGCIVIYKELIAGIIGIFKFSATVFSIPLFALAILFGYDIFTIVECIVSPNGVNISSTSLFGFTTSLFLLSALVSNLLICIREEKTFNFIANAQELYSVEMITSDEKPAQGTDNIRSHEMSKQIKGRAVEIKKTRFISEFFKKNSESAYGIGYISVALLIIPLVAIILAYVVIATGRGAADVTATIIFTLFTCLSVSFVLINPITLFAASERLLKRNCTFVGSTALKKYENVDTVIFPDTSAFEINSDFEVIPIGEADMTDAINIANRLFLSLGGVMSVLASDSFSRDRSVSQASLNIALVSDDGIELYMDNETHILLGNEKFMSAYRTKLGLGALSFISANKYRGKEIIYLAINQSLSLGYVVSRKIKDGFTDAVLRLAENNIGTVISTYEPHTKAFGIKSHKVGIYKPYEHEDSGKQIARCGDIVISGDPKYAVYPVIMSKNISKVSKLTSKISLWFILFGIIISLAVTLVGYLVSAAAPLLRYRDIFTSVMQIISIISITIASTRLAKVQSNKNKEKHE